MYRRPMRRSQMEKMFRFMSSPKRCYLDSSVGETRSTDLPFFNAMQMHSVIHHPSKTHACLQRVPKHSQARHMRRMAPFSNPFCTGYHILISIYHQVFWVLWQVMPHSVAHEVHLRSHVVLGLFFLHGLPC